MARCGVQTLLCKYKNPISYSCRILINKKSYYHPYEMKHSTYGGWVSVIRIENTTKIGDARLDTSRSLLSLIFRYHIRNYAITFIHRIDDSISIIIHNLDAKDLYTWIDKDTPSDKFIVQGYSKFSELANKIVETTLSEIYKNHLPTILSLIEI